MATTENNFNGNGTAGPFTYTFPVIEAGDVKVFVNGVTVSNYTVDTTLSTVTFTSPFPTAGQAIRIFRETNIDTLSAEFSAGSAIRAVDLNDNFIQNLYVTQEISNNAVLTDGSNAFDSNLNMGGNRITNLGTPTANDNAVTKLYVDSRLGSLEVPGFTRWSLTAVGGETTLSGAGTTGGTLAYSANREQVYLNGAQLQRDTDYTANNGTSVVLNVALIAGDVVEVICVNNLNGSTSNQSQDQFFVQSGTGATTRTVESKLRDVVSVKDFGAVGDGVTDDTAALQAALNSNKLVFMPPGLYRTTAQLSVNPTVNRNSGFIGGVSVSSYPYLQQAGGPTWDGQQEAIIKYDGAISSTVAVIAASSTAIGTEPAATFDTTIWSLILENITLDANERAGYGLFTARVQNLQLDRISTRGATIAGVSINGTYSGSIRSIRCSRNPGRGFELGAADERFGWTVQDKVNALYLYDLHAFANGSAATFRESDPVLRKDGCGVYFGPHRSVHIFGVVSENNFGANIVFEPTSTGNTIHGFYTELGCKYAPNGTGTDAVSLGYATKQWGVIFAGVSGGSSKNNRLVDGICAIDAIWLTGTEPSAAARESGFEIYNCSLATGGLTADWGNYRLVNCASELESITGSEPTGAYTIRGGLQFGSGLSQLTAYEEGTFTPTLLGITTAGTGWAYSLQVGSYTRVGRMVFVSGRVSLSAVSGDATGQIAIGGLPFTVKNSNNFQAPGSLARTINFATNVVSLEAAARLNFPQLLLTKRTTASASSSSVVLADLSSTTAFDFACSYVVE